MPSVRQAINICIFTLISHHVIAQSPKIIYSFGFEPPSDWTEYNGTKYLSDSNLHDPILWKVSTKCPRWMAGYTLSTDKTCVQTFADTHLSRVIPTEGYHSIQLKIDVNPNDVESNEWCYIQYRSQTAPTDWENKDIVNGHYTPEIGFTVTVPNTNVYNDQSLFEVKIGIRANAGGDSCYFDNLEVFGIPYTRSPTSDPTDTPTFSTLHPTIAPSVVPTPNPTVAPTLDPTKAPTSVPTYRPTKNPSRNPTSDPTSNPSVAPTLGPTNMPTVRPTDHRTMNPTAKPTVNPIVLLIRTTVDAILPIVNSNSPKIDTQIVVILAGLGVGIVVVIACIILLLVKIKGKKTHGQQMVAKTPPRTQPREPKIVCSTEESVQKEGDKQLVVCDVSRPQVLSVTDEGDVREGIGSMQIETRQEKQTTAGGDVDEEMNNINIADDEFIIDEDHNENETERGGLVV
eukprot:281396_1